MSGASCMPPLNQIQQWIIIMSEEMFGTGVWLLMMLAIAAAVVVPFWFIFSKAGYSKWLALLMAFPLVNVILLYFIAFSKWPVRETRIS
jgi:type II secretory pathway component PulF